MTLQTTAAAILAGGRARRFGGRDKSRLLVDGRSIIVRQVEALQLVADPVFVVGHDPDRFADLALRVVPDLVAGLGALGGILTALRATPADRVLVVACDLPFLTEGVFRALADRATEGDAAWVETARGPEPLIACYRQSAVSAIEAAIAEGDLKAAHLAHRMTVVPLSTEALAAFGAPEVLVTNLNSPDDYARVQ